VHSHRPLPDRSHLQRTRYNALSVGKKTPKNAPFSWDFVTLPDGDRTAAIGNTRSKIGKNRACDSGSRGCETDRRTDRQTCSSQYIAIAAAGEEKKRPGNCEKVQGIRKSIPVDLFPTTTGYPLVLCTGAATGCCGFFFHTPKILDVGVRQSTPQLFRSSI